jgi:hypothetical protein
MPRPKQRASEQETAARQEREKRLIPGTIMWHVLQRGKQRVIEYPEELLEAAREYFEWVEENPMFEMKPYVIGAKVKMVEVPKARVPILRGLCAFIGISSDAWRRWKKERPDLLEALELIEDVIYENKFAGAAAGLFNAALVSRDLGLADKTEVTGAEGGPIQTEEVSQGASDFTRKLSRLAASLSERDDAVSADAGRESSPKP